MLRAAPPAPRCRPQRHRWRCRGCSGSTGRAISPISTRIPVGSRTVAVLTHSGFMLPVPDPALAARAVGEFLSTPVEWFFHLALRLLRARPGLAEPGQGAGHVRRGDLQRAGRGPRHAQRLRPPRGRDVRGDCAAATSSRWSSPTRSTSRSSTSSRTSPTSPTPEGTRVQGAREGSTCPRLRGRTGHFSRGGPIESHHHARRARRPGTSPGARRHGHVRAGDERAGGRRHSFIPGPRSSRSRPTPRSRRPPSPTAPVPPSTAAPTGSSSPTARPSR